MKSSAWLVACAAVAASTQGYALGALASVSIIDQETGAALPTYYHQGEYWVAGTPGARYAIQVRNCDAGRVLAVTSVDGINVITGKNADVRQGGYVFDPGEEYRIAGWRKNHSEVAAFTFTASPDSYAERTGRPANVGVIGVALFRERDSVAAYAPRAMPPVPAPPLGSAAASAAQSAARESRSMLQDGLAASAAPRLGTGHGEREYSYVSDTVFNRAQSEPNEVIRIRYDSLERLTAMGVIGPGAPPAPNPFPGMRERGFVPDPPG